MTRKERKIGFYYIVVNKRDDLLPYDAFTQVVEHIKNKSKVNRRKNINTSKFGFLASAPLVRNIERCNIIFKSAIDKFRPPLLDRNTVDERESPKTLTEGDCEKTHMISKNSEGELLIVLEKHRDGISIKQFVEYLNKFSLQFEEPIFFGYEIIVRDNFLEVLNTMDRIVSAEVQVDKQMLGGDALNFSERINTAKHEIVVKINAKNRNSIEDFAKDVFAKMNGGENRIKRIRLKCRNDENNIIYWSQF